MEAGESSMESVPNSQEIINMMLQMPEHSATATAYSGAAGDCRLLVPVEDASSSSSSTVVNNNNIVNSNNNNLPYYITTSQHIALIDDENEQELQSFAEMLMAPTTPQMMSAAQQQQQPHHAASYHDIKPMVDQHEWIGVNLNSTIVNQSLKSEKGEYGFEVFFDSHEKVTKNMTWTYSAEVGRLYVMLNSQCPFKVGTSRPPPDNSYIVIIPVYKDAVSRSENVVRCPHHCRNLDASGLMGKFWINSRHPKAVYQEDVQNSNRHCLIVPFETPHTGCLSYTYLFEFMCRNTCVGGVNRRATEVVFLLQHQGTELGRAVIEVKVCACPGRDRRTDETTLAKRISMENSAPGTRGGHRSGGLGGSGHSGKLKLAAAGTNAAVADSSSNCLLNSTDNEHDNGADGEQLFMIRVRGKANYEILKRVAEGLELRAQHQRVKKRKVTGDAQQRSQLQQYPLQQNGVAAEVKREGEIVYSDG